MASAKNDSSAPRRQVRWGIMGAAGIARKNMPFLAEAKNARVVAVASRGLDRAQAFAAEYGVPLAFGSYDELLACEEVDAVYVPLPTGVRAAWAIKAARAGKHILCEKPAGCSAAEVASIVGAAREAGVHYMDGVTFMHNPRLDHWRRIVDDKAAFGHLTRVTTGLSFVGSSDQFRATNIRCDAEAEPLGCLGDLGWYNVRVSQWAFGYALPVRATARVHASHGAVPTDMTGTLDFGDGRVAEMHFSFEHARRQWAELLGSRGRLCCEDFLRGHLREFRVETPEGGHVTHRDPAARDQLTLMWEAFGRLVLDAVPVASEESTFWGRLAYTTQCVVDALHASGRAGGEPVEIAYGDLALQRGEAARPVLKLYTR